MIDFSNYLDKETKLMGYGTWGKLGTTDPEVDAIFHTMHWFYFANFYGCKRSYNNFDINQDFWRCHDLFVYKNGIYKRFPRKGQDFENLEDSYKGHFNQPWNLSRDNLLPMIVALGAYGGTKEILWAFLRMMSRLFLFQNFWKVNGERNIPDIAFPNHWNVFFRALIQSKKSKIIAILLYPLIMFGDIFYILDRLLFVVHTRFIEPDKTGSELNFVSQAIQAETVCPTIFSKIGNWIYKKFRANMSEFGNESSIMNALHEFFSKGKRKDRMAPLDLYVEPVVKKYL